MGVTVTDFEKCYMELNIEDTHLDRTDLCIWVIPSPFFKMQFSNDEMYFTGKSIPARRSDLHLNLLQAAPVYKPNYTSDYTIYPILTIILTGNIVIYD